MHFACEINHVEIVNKLLKKEADVNTLRNGNNALLLQSQNTELIELLINNGIDVNARDKFGKVALHCACERGYVEIVKKLLEKGADISACDNENKNAVYYTFQYKSYDADQARSLRIELIQLLISNGIVD